MMLVGVLGKKEDINLKVDGIIINLKGFSATKIRAYSLKTVNSLINAIHKLNKKSYLNLNRLYHEEEMERLKEILPLISDNLDGILFMDLGLVELVPSLKDKLIYNPLTFNTCVLDSDFLKELNIQGMIISKDITLEDIKSFKGKDMVLGYIGHGYQQIFYSKRKFLTYFYEYKNLVNKPGKKYLIEQLRDEKHPIFEDTFGTYVYSAKKLSSFNEFNELRFLDLFIIAREFLSDEEYLETIDFYNNLKDGIKDEKYILKYQDSCDTGFYYHETLLKVGDKSE